MMLGGTTLATVPIGGLQQEHSLTDAQATQPFTLEIGGVNMTEQMRVESLTIDGEQGRQQRCAFTMVGVDIPPDIGQRVRVLYFSEVLFAGSIDRRHITITPSHGDARFYEYECADHAHILFRRKLRQNFTNVTLHSLVTALLNYYVSGEGLTIAEIESSAMIPLVDIKDTSVYDALQSAANIMGATFYIDDAKGLHFVSTTAPAAPRTLIESAVESIGVTIDRERYRNRQTVFVTGTVPEGSNEDERTTTVIRENTAEIAARQAIDGGTGIYEDIQEVTHPISNDATELFKLGYGTALSLMSLSGIQRRTLRARIRGYGFRAGQVAVVDLPLFGVTGTWVIQRASLNEVGFQLVYDLELTESSALLRSYDSWLRIVDAGKVVVMLPASVTNNLTTFNTTGSHNFVVPAGVTEVAITVYGAGGGGGGGLRNSGASYGGTGQHGGAGGLAYKLLTVISGETLTIVVGAGGVGGVKKSVSPLIPPDMWGNAGTSGAVSYVQQSGVIKCQGNGGTGGLGGNLHWNGSWTFPNLGTAAAGSGLGDAVTVGGGESGGTGGAWTPTDGTGGKNGRVEVAW